MPNPYFSFKQFTVFHDKCAMKVGIDGVLLGAWVNVDHSTSILDIGTGTGLIALMLAQRSNAQIRAIEIDQNAVLQAKENVKNSPWLDRIYIQEISLQQFTINNSEKYDLIVSNPPYFVNSTKTPVENRTTARHTDSLSHEELILNAKLLLRSTGRICLILPIVEGFQIVELAIKMGLFCSKQITVYPKQNAVAKRFLLEFCLTPTPRTVSDLIIEESRHQYTTAFSALVKDYYLKL
ncbi:MAG: methyltransferase [Paludibacter sp.]|nr:methyltransferase [Paludibacter sp.]